MLVKFNIALKMSILNQNIPILTTEMLRVPLNKIQQMFFDENKQLISYRFVKCSDMRSATEV
jgi:hypothetical protein